MAPKAEKKPAKKVAKSTSSAAAKKRKLAKAEDVQDLYLQGLEAGALDCTAPARACYCEHAPGCSAVLVSTVLLSVCLLKTAWASSSHATMLYRRCTQTLASAPRRCRS